MISALLALAACGPKAPPPAPAAEPPRALTVLAINDTYRIEGDTASARGGLARVRTLRRELEAEGRDVLVLHAGDFLFPSFLSRQTDGAHMVDVLGWLDGDPAAFDDRLLVTFGNHEFDKGKAKHAPLLDARIEESGFRWVASNIRWTVGEDGQPMVASAHLVEDALVQVGGVWVGVFGLTLPFTTPGYVDGYDDLVDTARQRTASLRARGAEVVIGLTHQDLAGDIALVDTLGKDGPDLVVGGHEHARQVEERAGRFVVKADADAWSAAVVTLSMLDDGVDTQVEIRDLTEDGPAPDPGVLATVDAWIAKHAADFCGEGDGACLAVPLTTAGNELHAAELDIRRFETNLGDWVADRMLDAWRDAGVQVAFINAGALRLNRDIAAGAAVTQREVEELLPYPSETQRIRITGALLGEILTRSVQDWTGQGHFAQVAGVAFRHDPATATVSDLTLLTPDGPRPIGPDDVIEAVTVSYLTTPSTGQDGYTMLLPAHNVGDRGPAVKQLVRDALTAAGAGGIAPVVEGRICNPQRPGPCLAVAPD